MLRFVIARTEACPNQRTVMSLPHSAVSPKTASPTCCSPKLLTRETLAGVITALALIRGYLIFGGGGR
jgi:SulP family sulfate permease